MTGSNKPGELITVVFGLCRMPFILAQNFKDTGFEGGGSASPPAQRTMMVRYLPSRT
jgi:hypothetical protein